MLTETLMEYSKSGVYPFHMPGHKRNAWMSNPYALDITEIDGFDNLHHARGILQEEQRNVALLYGAKKSYYLVNGSTCGLLAAICAVSRKGERVLVARNCHKAVYHALELRELIPEYIYPEFLDCGIQGAIQVEQIQQKLSQDKTYCAVILTSPTYDGIVSDIASIAELAHKYEIPVLVDQAHGAHFGFSDCFPKSAIEAGADAVIMSVHKTLPAFTQTALLHLCSDRISEVRVEKYLGMFETSSPSYVLMAGIERCMKLVELEGAERFSELYKNIQKFYKDVKPLQRLHVLKKEDLGASVYDYDCSKILIFTDDAGISGYELHEILLKEYQIQVEMVCANYVLALCSIMDVEEGFLKLSKALLEIDDKIKCIFKNKEKSFIDYKKIQESVYREWDRKVEIFEAAEQVELQEELPLKEVAGKICGTYIALYPPGIPMIVPGECVEKEAIEAIETCIKLGLEVTGLSENEKIVAVKL